MSFFDSIKTTAASTTTNGYESDKLDSLLFPVASVPLYWNHNGINNIVPEEYKGAGYMGVLDINREVILYAGREYSIIRNQSIVDALGPALDNGFKVTRVRNFNNTRFNIDLENPTLKSELIVGDQVLSTTARVRINNSYDGSLAFSMQMGFWVQVCSNGAIFGEALSYKKKHKSGNDCIEYVNEGLKALNQDGFHKNLSAMNKLWTVDATRVEGMFKQLTDGIPDPKDGIHPVKSQLLNRITVENKTYNNDVFAMFMAATNMTTYPQQYALSPSYLQRLEANIQKVFR